MTRPPIESHWPLLVAAAVVACWVVFCGGWAIAAFMAWGWLGVLASVVGSLTAVGLALAAWHVYETWGLR